LAVLASLLLLFGPTAQAQNGAPVLITQNVDENKLVTLAGNTRPEANKQNDRGLVADDLSMEHMLLQLKRSPQQERKLRQFIEELQVPSSPNFHHWLTAKQYGERFGLATHDLDAITRWLESNGFKVNVVYENGLLIDFSGTAGQVRSAFHTEIHQLDVKGVKHIANMSDPQIPAALAPAVVGVVSLHDFKPHTNYKPRANYTGPDVSCDFGTCYLVAPADLAMIYNLNPLFTTSISGQRQTIVVIEDTDVYTADDWTTFRTTFGLSSYTEGSFTQIHPAPPSGTNNCTDPGVNPNGNDGEAIIDAEYASAAAPSAAIVLASCSDTDTTFGGLIAVQNLLNESSTPPAIMSMSYGECEAFNGATSNAAFSSAFQQAVTEGVSVFVSAGDEGAAGCSADTIPPESIDTFGIGVSGFASTPYNVAVGGTDFGDTYAGTNSTYWGATNSSTYESALSYIPEIPWNDSCGSVLIATYVGGPGTLTYGTSGFCNIALGEPGLTQSAGSGGPSGCATGSPSVSGVVGGTCAGWPKPSWQSLVGNPSDTVRDIPDVSLFAANGVWDHYYPFCFSDPDNGGTACTGAPDTWSGAGGTSFASPIMAGIQALVNQYSGGRQGNPNPIYYTLAATEYGASGDSSCNSTLGNTVGSSCIFYDVTQGDMDVVCQGTYDCYLDSATYGVLSTSDGAYHPAYGTQTGWDFATGIGSVNAANLVNSWPNIYPATTTTVTSIPNPAPPGATVTFTATVTPTGINPPTGTVTFYDGNTDLGSGTLSTVGSAQEATFATSTLAVGTHSITAFYGGDANNAESTSAILSQVIEVPTFTFTNTGSASHTVLAGQTTLTYTFLATPTSASTFTDAVNIACSFSPTDPTLTSSVCSYSVNGGPSQSGSATIPAGSGASTVTMTVKTAGPNTGTGSQLRHRADNRSPWLPLALPIAGIVMAGFAGRKVSKHSAIAGLCVSLVLLGFLVACGGSSTPPPVVGISVTPAGSTVWANGPAADNWPPQTASFTATVTNTNNVGVSWTLSSAVSCTGTPSPCGSITGTATSTGSTGAYTAPTAAAGLPGSVTITATSAADSTKTATSAVTITPTTVPGSYSITVTATEGGGATPQTPGVSLVVQ
jgi:subtilase family serine protease